MEIKELKELQARLQGMIESLEAAPIADEGNNEYKLIQIDFSEKDDKKWKTLISESLKKARHFEIHCWNEEENWIELALQYGTLKESNWSYGKIIQGEVTPAFTEMILQMPKPSDTEIYNKMTPFFNLFLDEGFQSSHYGTEIYK